jgi:hypothetical protein
MWLRAPAHCTGLSHEGRAHHVGADGLIDVDDQLVPFFLAHGFVPCVGAQTRPDTTSGDNDRPDIEALSRRELFAFLRMRGARVRPPITNAALREAARRSLAGE